MNHVFKVGLLGACMAISLVGCKDDKDQGKPIGGEQIELKAHSKTPNFLRLEPEFSGVKIYPILSSEDVLEGSPKFIYGSMADGNGLMRNGDGTFSLINNVEAHYSIARITFDKTFKPVKGEYIVNATANGATAQCSGTLVTPAEHGFGPLYLSGGEWDGSKQGVIRTNPMRKSSEVKSPSELITSMGKWAVENAVPLNKNAYADKTVVFIGDDDSNKTIPSGQLGMYVGNTIGDLNGGKLYGLKVKDKTLEKEMKEGETYEASFVELTEKSTTVLALDQECKQKKVMGFARVEDIDYVKGSAKNNRTIYFCVTGKKEIEKTGTKYGRVYKLELNEKDPTAAAKITCVLDGDNLEGKAKAFHSPDNILVTENYAYIQEDPNGYFEGAKAHYASLYQYNLKTGALKKVLECDQRRAFDKGYGSAKSSHLGGIKAWEITGMVDISEVVGLQNTMLLITQNHGWGPKEGKTFIDPVTEYKGYKGNAADKYNEGSVLHVIRGLGR